MRFALVVTGAVLASSCALRLRYQDLVKPGSTVGPVPFVLRDADSGQPLPGVKFEMSEWKNVVRGTTAADGTFALPVDKKYFDEIPVFAVVLPAGVKHYRVDAVPPPVQAPVALPAPAPAADSTPVPVTPAPGAAPTEAPAGGPR